jgi:hypothetical protein
MSIPEAVARPFTPDQVVALEAFQRSGRFHPFTCPNRGDDEHRDTGVDLGALVPTVRGWICPYCDYTQDWAHGFMADPQTLERTSSLAR